MKSRAMIARAEAYLHPGDLLVTREPTAVKTILGSCIAVCLWDAELRCGGMNHFLLPKGSDSSLRPERFGNVAVPRLIELLVAQGSLIENLRAKIFGGAAMLTNTFPPPTQIGQQNFKLASELLAQLRIPVVGSDVGGGRGRKIVFNTDDGSVALWEL